VHVRHLDLEREAGAALLRGNGVPQIPLGLLMKTEIAKTD
jgi:hypothetical protein